MTDPTDPAITAQDHWDYLGALALGDEPPPLQALLAAVQALLVLHHHDRLAAQDRTGALGRPGAKQATAALLDCGRQLVRETLGPGLPPWLTGLEDPPRSAQWPRPAPTLARDCPGIGRSRRRRAG